MNKIKRTISNIVFCSLLIIGVSSLNAQDKNAPKTTLEEVQEKCKDLPRNKKVRITVSRFNVATPNAGSQFGKQMQEMLSNALENVNCFNVIASLEDQDLMDEEIRNSQSGRTAAGMGPQAGKGKGPQVLVTGKITEYSEGTTSGGFGRVSITKNNKAHIGFIIKLIDAETREVIDSKSFNVDGSAGKTKSLSIAGFKKSTSSNTNKSLDDALEQGIIEGVEYIASMKDKMELPESEAITKSNKREVSISDCNILKGPSIPKIMVILPEFHITRRIPDPAAETEINRKLLEFGFEVVDAAMYATIANGESFVNASKDPKAAISLGKEFGADIVIYGEAFSQLVENTNGQSSCRARVEVKAVRTDNASMLAANGLEAGALDNAEFVAHKSALRSAGGLVADYLIEQFCKRSMTFKK